MFYLFSVSTLLILHGFHACLTISSPAVVWENTTNSIRSRFNTNQSKSVTTKQILHNQHNIKNDALVLENNLNNSIQYCQIAKDKNNTWKGIERRRSDSVYPFEQSKNYSPIGFTKGIDFPQLSKYRKGANTNSIHQVLNFLRTEMYRQKNGVVSGPKRKVKFSGAYMYPRRSDSIKKNIAPKLLPTPFKQSMNGHAYNSDPLMPYKPSQPGDINLMATKLFRFSPSLKDGHDRNNKVDNFHNKCAYKIGLPCNDNEIRGSTLNPNNIPAVNSQVFHNQPHTLGESIENVYEIRGKKTSKKRPLSVILDLYPMDDEDEEIMQIPNHLKQSMYTKPINVPYNNIRQPLDSNSKPAHHYPQIYPGNNYHYAYRYPGYYHTTPYNPHRSNSRGSQRYSDQFKSTLDTDKENDPVQMKVYFNLYPRKKRI